MAKKQHAEGREHEVVEVDIHLRDSDCDPAPTPAPNPEPTPGGIDDAPPTPEQTDAAAQAFYSAMSAQLGQRYARSVKAGDAIEPWEQLTPAEQDGFRNGAFAVLTMDLPVAEPEP